MPQLKVAHFIDTNVTGGAETLIGIMAEEQVKRGMEVVFLHFGHPHLVETAKKLGIKEYIVPGHEEYKSIKTLHKFAKQFRAFLEEHKITAVHSHLYGPAIGTGAATAFTKIKHVATLHDSYILKEKQYRVLLLYLISIFGSKIVCVSNSIRSYIKAVIPFLNPLVVLNGVVIPEVLDKPAARSKLGFPLDETLAICVGRLEPVKNHKFLLNAWKNVSNAKLLIVGEGNLEGELNAYTKELGLEESVAFAGFRSDISTLLTASDLFTLTSTSEGLSCSIMEALAHGLPCVVTDVGGNSELITEGENGCLVNTEAAAAHKIQSLINDGPTRQQMSQKARNRAKSSFSLKAMVDSYLELYTR